jgi:lactoylglutathione lyase
MFSSRFLPSLYRSQSTIIPRIIPSSTITSTTISTIKSYQFKPFSTTTIKPIIPGETKPFQVLGIQQIAIGGENKTALNRLWNDCFGIQKISSFKSIKENVDEDILQIGEGVHAVEIDIMQPIDINKSPKVHIPSLNHIGLWIDNLEVAVKWLSEHGMRFTPGGIRAGAAGYNVIFIHPKGNEQTPLSGEGVLIELVQAPEHIIKALKK